LCSGKNLLLVRDFPTTGIKIAKKIQGKSSGIRFAALGRVWSFKNLLLKEFAEKEEHSS
jgi:hypothetical protein